MLHALLAVTLLLQQPPVAPPAPSTPPKSPPSFAEVAAEHFASWDRNTDGKLDADEIDVLCVDPKVTGEQAAAAAAIKRIVRSGKYAVPELTREYLTTPPKPVSKPASKLPVPPHVEPATATQPPAQPPAKASTTDPLEQAAGSPDAQDHRDAPEQPATLKRPNFQAGYASSLRKIRATRPDLFRDDTPDLDHCHQGPLGDCYFVAAVGAFVHRDSAAVKQMIKERDGGGYDVHFGDGRSIELPPLTDAELALSGTTGDEGLWLPVLEKALGALRHQADPKRYAMETSTDAIARGGSTATIIRMLTGHQTTRIVLKKRPRGTVPGPDGKPVPKPPVPAADPDELAARLRTEVGSALREKRLVACGAGTEPHPPGINGKHAYAVLAFDAENDLLTLWNPHGNTFRPKGEAGLEHGYATRAGVFRIPVRDFVQVFGGLALETDRALPAATQGPGK
ncbi:MAG TPA: C2 family cysteine protease [Planctomycetota bacterium]|nr:C2 family cysteine protease [Planctomycetota bacterium]